MPKQDTNGPESDAQARKRAVPATPPSPPPVGSTDFFGSTLHRWDATKKRALRADFETKFRVTAALRQRRAEFGEGARALGLVGRRTELKPQQLCLADLLNLGRRFTTVLWPRRSSKTTTIFAWLVGRCIAADLAEPLLCAYAVMTTQKVARRRFLVDFAPALERTWPNYRDDPASPVLKILKGAGQERIEFRNGSVILIHGPEAEAFRSDAYDVIVLDEAGEPLPDKVDDVLSAALPTQDTRPGAMIVFAGTAGKFTEGNMLWDEMRKAMDDDPRRAAHLYFAPQHTSLEELQSWEPTEEHPAGHVRELVEQHHPGIGTLTTLDSVKDNFDRMKPEQFAREYLGIFTETGAAHGLIAPKRWDELQDDGEDLPQLPDRFALTLIVHPDQQSASITAAWRDEKGVACGLVLDHRPGVDWAADRVLGLARKFKTPIVHDTQGAIMVEVEFLGRQTPRPRMEPQTWKDVRTAHALLLKEIDLGNFRHWAQPSLTAAALAVVKRQAGPNMWAFGRPTPESDITDIEGIALGLRQFDEKGKKRQYVVI